MGRQRGRSVITTLVIAALMSAILPAGALAAAPATGERIWGANRYATAAAIARQAFPGGAPVVYLARGDVAADALAAGALTDGPVLLVPSCGPLPDPVRGALAALGPKKVIGLGGTSAVCNQLLRDTGIPWSRLAGDTRYATAAAVALRAFPKGAGVVYLARGDVAADALAAGALTDGPLLLVPRTGTVPSIVRETVAKLAPARVVALGGTQAVSPSVLRAAAGSRSTSRIAGENRYATAVLVAQRAFPEGAPVVYLARADVAADALAAGALTDGPVVLTPACGGLPAAVAGWLESFGAATVIALGGPSAVCDATLGVARTAVTSRHWLAAVNAFRRAGGLEPVKAEPAWTSDAAAIARYMVDTGTVTHRPASSNRYYSPAAARGGANSNLFASSLGEQSPARAIEQFMRSPAAAAWITHPRLTRAAYGSYANPRAAVWRFGAALDVIRGNDHRPVTTPTLWPADGGRVPLANGMNQLDGCDSDGLLANVRHAPGVTVTKVRWVDDAGTPVPHCVSSQASGDEPRSDLTWIQADAPLRWGGRYRLTVDLSDGRTVSAMFDVVAPADLPGYPAG